MIFCCGFVACLSLTEPLEANQLVAKSLAAEATWRAFPGFVADLEMEYAGRVHQGRVVVDGAGRVFVDHVPALHRDWAMQRLGCVVRQRFPKDELANKTWMFVNPRDRRSSLGQAVCRTDAPFGVNYWIQGGQFRAVEYRSARHRHRLTTLKTDCTPARKHLPAVQVLHSWNVRTQELESTETTLCSWQHMGEFDLPATIIVLSAGSTDPAPSAIGRMVLTRHQLFTRPDLVAIR